MAHIAWMSILRHVRRLGVSCPGSDISDAALLERFTASHDEAAFAALVDRHGPMVWGVCGRLLSPGADAEDAFQATFVVLARKAATVDQPELLGPWLYGVAWRVASRLRRAIVRRRAREMPLLEPPAANANADVDQRELRRLLDEEVNRLPDRFRVAFVLCHFEGLTNEEAAQLLGCPKGTVQSRLSRARERLRKRLSQRGVGLSGAVLAAEICEPVATMPVPADLAAVTSRLGGALDAGLVPSTAGVLAEGVMTTMTFTKTKLMAAVLVVLGLCGVGGSLLAHRDDVQQKAPTRALDTVDVAVATPAPKQPEVHDQAKRPTRPDVELRDTLARTAKYDGLDDPKTTLVDAIDQISSRFNIQFAINEKSYALDWIPKLRETEIAKSPLPPMTAPLSVILHKVLTRLPPECESTYFIRNGTIEIISAVAARRELGLPPDSVIPPLVYERFENTPILDAFQAISDYGEVNVVLDLDAAAHCKNLRISAPMWNTLSETAARTVAAAANLHAARLGNVLFVTGDAAKAETLERKWRSSWPTAPAPPEKRDAPQKKK
jgi:RNA polymerase sigma factor (sigma-70 family)